MKPLYLASILCVILTEYPACLQLKKFFHRQFIFNQHLQHLPFKLLNEGVCLFLHTVFTFFFVIHTVLAAVPTTDLHWLQQSCWPCKFEHVSSHTGTYFSSNMASWLTLAEALSVKPLKIGWCIEYDHNYFIV